MDHIRNLKLTYRIHENCSTLLQFSFSYAALSKMGNERLHGEWKYYWKMTSEIARERAEAAALDLALCLRIVLELEGFKNKADRQKQSSWSNVGERRLTKNGSFDGMDVWDVCNKIIHSKRFEWDFSKKEQPRLITFPADEISGDWDLAIVDIWRLSCICAEFMS